MPMIIPAIVGYAVTAAATGAVIAGVTISALGAAVIGGLASLATSALLKNAMSPGNDSMPIAAAATTQPGAGRSTQFRQPTPPHDVVVGRIKKSGPIMFMHSAPDDGGRVDGYFYIQIALASHHCKAVECVYLGDDLSTDSKFTGYVTIGTHLGTDDQVEDATFLADLPTEFADHWLRGRCHIASRLKGNATAFPNGVPNHSAIVWGVDDITDPRTGVTGWTNNAILIVYWWMVWGEGYSADDFDEDQLIAAANVCDERVRVIGSTCTFTVDTATDVLTLSEGARSLDVGDGVRVSTSGSLPAGLSADTTYYVHPTNGTGIKLCTSVANAFAGTGINITSSGSGTQTLTYWDEARYKCNGSFSLDADKREIRDQLLTACGGYAIEIGGLWFLHAACAATPTVTLTEDDLRDGMVTVPKRSLRDKINTVRCVFVNPDKGWQPDDAPPLISTEYVTEDNAEASVTLRTPFTLSARCVQRLMQLTLRQNRLQRSVKFPAKLTAFRIKPLDGVYLTNERYGWTAEQHRCMGWVLAEDGGIDLLLNEDSATVNEWNYLTDERVLSAPQGVTLPDPSTIAAPSALTVTTPTTPEYTTIAAEFDAVLSIWLDGYDVEYKADGATDWTGYGRIGRNASREISVERASPQDFRVRAVALSGATSDWTEALAPDAPTSPSATAGTGQITVAWTAGAGAVSAQVFVNTTNDFTSATLLATDPASPYVHTGLSTGETRYYWLRSVSARGNISGASTVVSATAL